MQDDTESRPPVVGEALLSSGLALGVLALAFGSLRLWSGTGVTLLPSTAVSLAIAIPLIIAGVVTCIKNAQKLTISPVAFGVATACMVLTDKFDRGFNLLQGPLIQGEILLCALVGLWILRTGRLTVVNFAMLLTPAILIYCFAAASNGKLIYIDDHATFMYRLILLKENFPFIPFYSPHWNAGIDARDFFATGALNIFTLFSPLIYLFKIEQIYNLIVALLLFGLLPCVVYITARLEGLRQPIPAFAVVLSLTTSVTWYRWALHYGTMGFITTCVLSPLVLALATRIVTHHLTVSRWLLLLTFFTVTLMLFWSPSGLAFLPLIGLALLRLPSVIRKPGVKLLTAALLVVNTGWILIFWSAANVSHYLEGHEPLRIESTAEDISVTKSSIPLEEESEHAEPTPTVLQRLKVSLDTLRENANSANPLLILMVIPGIFLMRGSSQLPWGLYLAWLAFLGTIAVPYIPALDLDRMLIFFSLAACIPCACAITSFLRSTIQRPILLPLGALTLGIFFTAIFSTGSTVRNRGNFHYSFTKPLIPELTGAIQQHHQNGRVLFTGFVLHEFNGAHLAPLAHFTGVPLMASSYVHRYWEYTEIVPEKFLAQKHTGGIERFFDLYNVGALVAHDRKWREYFTNRPERYRLAWRKGPISLFTRNNFESNFFLSGEGRVEKETSNSVTLTVQSSEAVVKYRYYPFVTSSSCSISGESVADQSAFIKLTNCTPGNSVVISSKAPHTRIAL